MRILSILALSAAVSCLTLPAFAADGSGTTLGGGEASQKQGGGNKTSGGMEKSGGMSGSSTSSNGSSGAAKSSGTSLGGDQKDNTGK